MDEPAGKALLQGGDQPCATPSTAPAPLQDVRGWHSLKVRITVGTLLLVLGSIWSLAFYTSKTLREELQQQLGEQQFSTVSMLAAHLDDELALRLKTLEVEAGRLPAALGLQLLQVPACLFHQRTSGAFRRLLHLLSLLGLLLLFGRHFLVGVLLARHLAERIGNFIFVG